MPGHVEHERKFVVCDADLVRRLVTGAAGAQQIVQGYLVERHGIVVRVRRANGAGLLTVKGPRQGDRRAEEEIAVSEEMTDLLLAACHGHLISKVRYPYVDRDLAWTVDVFAGGDDGLVMAEIEDPPADLRPPAWCPTEVTEDDRFYNAFLSEMPFADWPDKEAWALDWRADG